MTPQALGFLRWPQGAFGDNLDVSSSGVSGSPPRVGLLSGSKPPIFEAGWRNCGAEGSVTDERGRRHHLILVAVVATSGGEARLLGFVPLAVAYREIAVPMLIVSRL